MPGPSFEQVPFSAGDTSQGEEARRRFEQLGKKADIGVQRVNTLRQQVDVLIAELDAAEAAIVAAEADIVAAEADILELQLRRVEYGQGFTYVAGNPGTLDVKIGNGIEFVGSEVSAKANAAKGVVIETAGIGINAGHGVELVSNAIYVKAQGSATSAMVVEATGVRVHFGELTEGATTGAKFVIYNADGVPKYLNYADVVTDHFVPTLGTAPAVTTGYVSGAWTITTFNDAHRQALYDSFTLVINALNQQGFAINSIRTTLQSNGMA